jgi:hypothetical protein
MAGASRYSERRVAAEIRREHLSTSTFFPFPISYIRLPSVFLNISISIPGTHFSWLFAE